MTYTLTRTLSVDDFIAQYGDDPRYELADRDLIDMEPTGPHEAVGGKLAVKIGSAITDAQHPWCIPRTCLIRPSGEAATARRPDVVEVVSPNWETDYARKVEEYALLGIPEYWIVDFRGLGGTAFIGKPKQPTFTVCQLEGDEYRQRQYRLEKKISSPLSPDLQLRLDDVLPRR